MTNNKKWALVTGAAGGIGKEICHQLAKEGFSLILCGRNEDSLQKLANEIPAQSVWVTADLSKKDGIDIVLSCMEQYSVCALVCNAGMGYVGKTKDQSRISAEDMISVMVTAPTLLVQKFITLPHAEYLLMVSSVAGFAPDPYMNIYGSCKSYMNQFTLALRKELHSNIHITLLAPGPVATAFDQKAGCTAQRKGLSPAICARKAVKGLLKGKKVVFPSFGARCCHWAMKVLPEVVMTPIIEKIQKRKIK